MNGHFLRRFAIFGPVRALGTRPSAPWVLGSPIDRLPHGDEDPFDHHPIISAGNHLRLKRLLLALPCRIHGGSGCRCCLKRLLLLNTRLRPSIRCLERTTGRIRWLRYKDGGRIHPLPSVARHVAFPGPAICPVIPATGARHPVQGDHCCKLADAMIPAACQTNDMKT
jgi:hypothetical protein